MLTIKPIPAFNDNYIWLIRCEATEAAFLVDPGDGEAAIKALEAAGLTLAGILITHHHFDHVGGLASLRQRYPGAVVYGPNNPAIDGIDQPVAADDTVEVLGQTFTVVEVPGHTLDHIAYYCEPEQTLFCGDTLFAGGCGRLFEGTPAMMRASLDKLAKLPAVTEVYCAHEYTLANLAFALAVEPHNQQLQAREQQAQETRAEGSPTVPSTIAIERDTNPFMRCQAPELLQSLQQQGRIDGGTADEIFATVRAWKDDF